VSVDTFDDLGGAFRADVLHCGTSLFTGETAPHAVTNVRSFAGIDATDDAGEPSSFLALLLPEPAGHLETKPDICYLIDEFLEQGTTAAMPCKLSDFVGSSHSLLARPQDPVFHEGGARLIGPDGTTPGW
jgi:hypothetical protein